MCQLIQSLKFPPLPPCLPMGILLSSVLMGQGISILLRWGGEFESELSSFPKVYKKVTVADLTFTLIKLVFKSSNALWNM